MDKKLVVLTALIALSAGLVFAQALPPGPAVDAVNNEQMNADMPAPPSVPLAAVPPVNDTAVAANTVSPMDTPVIDNNGQMNAEQINADIPPPPPMVPPMPDAPNATVDNTTNP